LGQTWSSFFREHYYTFRVPSLIRAVRALAGLSESAHVPGADFGVAPRRIFRNIFGSILNLAECWSLLGVGCGDIPLGMSVGVSINVDR
jgi:hypothetical protein